LHGGVVVVVFVVVLAATVSLFAATWRATLTLRREEDALPAKTNVVVVEVIFVGSCIDGV
jgi:hypothetical protein